MSWKTKEQARDYMRRWRAANPEKARANAERHHLRRKLADAARDAEIAQLRERIEVLERRVQLLQRGTSGTHGPLASRVTT